MTNQRQPTGGADEPERILGERVRAYREKLSLTQDAIAADMTARGHKMGQSTIAKIEAAQRPVRVNEAVDLAAILRVTLDDLISGQDAGQDALAAARAEVRDLAAQVYRAARTVEERRAAAAAAVQAAHDSQARLDAIQERYAEAEARAAALETAAEEE